MDPLVAELAVAQPHVGRQVERWPNAQEVVLDLLGHFGKERSKLGSTEQHGHARCQHSLLPLLLDLV